jgi:hypothetical protein
MKTRLLAWKYALLMLIEQLANMKAKCVSGMLRIFRNGISVQIRSTPRTCSAYKGRIVIKSKWRNALIVTYPSKQEDLKLNWTLRKPPSCLNFNLHPINRIVTWRAPSGPTKEPHTRL